MNAKALRLIGCCVLSRLLVVASQEPIIFSEGAKCLFIGHSFFRPVADDFNTFATSDSSTYPNHGMETFFRGGDKGSPLYLWDNHKEEIEAKLNSSDIELFGMTVAAGDTNLTEQELLDGYTQWFDLALSYNPNTAFFIGLPWADYPSSYDNAMSYTDTVQGNGVLVFSGVSMLRDLYPNNDVYYLNYGTIAAKARSLFEYGDLVDITDMIGDDPDTSIFVDQKGHAGTMVLNLAALAWLYWFYGSDFDTLVNGATSLGWNDANVIDIFLAAGQANQQYQLF